MFERFTDRARRVVVLSEQEARAFPHDHVHTVHTLLGLILEGEGVAGQVLAALGVTAEAVREKFALICPPADRIPAGHIPFDPSNTRLLETALREALALGHNYIGTEHILLAVARLSGDTPAAVLAVLGHSSLDVRAAVLEKLGSYEDSGARIRPGQRPVALLYRTQPSASDVLAAARAVAERLADLDGYLERRAAQIAAVAITEAIAECDKEVESAKAATVRQQDLVAELSRQLKAQVRRAERSARELVRLQREARREVVSDG